MNISNVGCVKTGKYSRRLEYSFLIFNAHKQVLRILGLFGNYSDILFLRRTSKLNQPFLQTDGETQPVFVDPYVAVDETCLHGPKLVI